MYANILEEEIKNKIEQDYFNDFDATRIIGKVDFCVTIKNELPLFETQSVLWAEAKKGQADIYTSLVQLILTVGKARTFDSYLPPAFLGAFDAEKIAFVPYSDVNDIFYQNDFNWNVAPSNHETKEFKQVFDRVKTILDAKFLVFYYEKDDKDLRQFIKENFVVGKRGTTKIRIDKNNFITIYNKWLNTVKPTIAVNWEMAKKSGIIDGDFFLADLLSAENETLKDKLFVLLRKNIYELDRIIDDAGFFIVKRIQYTDNQIAHTQFWNKYERPPAEEYWDYIVDRRDLLVPQDIRERKGSFFTPQIWVELSQRYLADYLGPDWQDEYYIWDCAAGTGNLLAGLTNKYNLWASTLDKQDVDVMKDRIQNGANLLEDHVFQFDFLNDDFSKLPKKLKEIIDDPEKRKKLVIYINPPYAEAGSTRQRTGTGNNKFNLTAETKIYQKYFPIIRSAANELFTLFLTRIFFEIPECIIGNFSKTKHLQSSNFIEFRKNFKADLEKCFLMPANSFDNVTGFFPIGFFVWNLKNKLAFESFEADIYNKKGEYIAKKTIYSYDDIAGKLNDWLSLFKIENTKSFIGYLMGDAPDFQNNRVISILNQKGKRHGVFFAIHYSNIFNASIYFAVRHCIASTWLNDRDQFLYPNDGWKSDLEFQNDCLAFTIFHGQNRISGSESVNHWIPFTEYEVNSREKFDSNFMTNFILGKLKKESNGNLLGETNHRTTPLEFSKEAQAVFDAGRELWKYYHAQPKINVNASIYDIREYFQGRSENGKMNIKSEDENYNRLIGNLRKRLNILARKIEPKVYEYGFLKW